MKDEGGSVGTKIDQKKSKVAGDGVSILDSMAE